MENILNFVICFISTTLGAISGIGGGVIIKPVLDMINQMDISAISFLSGCTVLSMSMVSLLRSRDGETKISTKQSTYMAVGSMVGGVIGKQVFEIIKAMFENDTVVGLIQSTFMILLTVCVYFYQVFKQRIKTNRYNNCIVCMVIGFALGFFSSFLGIGGGPINLVALSFFFSMDSKIAALNSIYIILFGQLASLITSIATNSIPAFNVMSLLCMVAGGVMGGFCGRHISRKLTNQQVDQMFRFMLFLIIAISSYCFVRDLCMVVIIGRC